MYLTFSQTLKFVISFYLPCSVSVTFGFVFVHYEYQFVNLLASKLIFYGHFIISSLGIKKE